MTPTAPRARGSHGPSLNTPEQRLARLETSVFGIDGRGGVMDTLEQISDRVDKLGTALQRAGYGLAAATLSILAAILSHTL